LAALVSPNGRIGPVEFWIGFFVHSWLLHLIGVDQWVRALERGFAPQLGDDLRVGLFVLDLWLLWVHFARRWHDLDMRAAWTLVLLVPGLGWLFAFVMLGFVRGSRRRNRWGPPRPWRRVVRDLRDVVLRLPAGFADLRAPAFDRPSRTGDRPAAASPPPEEPPAPPESPGRVAPAVYGRPIHRGPIAPPPPPVVVRRRRGPFG
jgi:uncharacterized membrane protein YhaH (DUF805 family)